MVSAPAWTNASLAVAFRRGAPARVRPPALVARGCCLLAAGGLPDQRAALERAGEQSNMIDSTRIIRIAANTRGLSRMVR